LEPAWIRAQHEQARKDVDELMGSVKHTTDGWSMELVGRLWWADKVEGEHRVGMDRNIAVTAAIELLERGRRH
jgi:hypothetical protein